VTWSLTLCFRRGGSRARSTRVTAEVVVPAEVVEAMFKATPAAIVRGCSATTLGALQAGMSGSGINGRVGPAARFVPPGSI